MPALRSTPWHDSTGRVALVSGAASGIGAAVATRLADEGATVVRSDVAATSPATSSATSRDPASCAAAVAVVLDRHGRLDVLANVAGVGISRLIGDLTLEEWRDVIDVNLTGTFLLSQSALPALLDTKGVIVNMGSVAGLRATPYNAAYCASKGGVIMLTKSMAIELAKAGRPGQRRVPGLGRHALPAQLRAPRGCRHGAAWPGPSSPMGRLIDPAEVAAAVAYLASDDAATVSGTTLVIDGAATA